MYPIMKKITYMEPKKSKQNLNDIQNFFQIWVVKRFFDMRETIQG